MLQKACNWLIAAGALVSFVGLIFLPSALNAQSRDQSMLGAGLAILAAGTLMVAISLYFKAKALRAQIDADPNLAAILNGKRRKGNCDGCHQAAPIVQCSMHKMHLCGECLAQHYNSRACVYVPAVRRVTRNAKGASPARP